MGKDAPQEDLPRPVVPPNARSIIVDDPGANQDALDAREELRRQSELLRITLSSIGDAVIATDANGGVTFMNPVAEALTGWTLAEASGHPLPEIFHIVNEYSRAEVENPALRALREGNIVGLANHTILIAKDGSERPIDDSASPIRADSGDLAGAVLVFRDVSEQKQAEKDRARLAAIVESSEDAILSKSLNGIVLSWNTGAERLFGYRSDEAVGRHITLIIPPERLDEEADIIRRICRGERVEHFETVRVTKDGRRRDISLTISPLRDAEGHVVGASKVARDVTERKLAEAENHRLNQEVEAERRRLADVFQSAPSFMCVLNGPEHVFERANDRYYELLGRGGIIGRPIREAIPEIAGQGFYEILDRVYQTGEPFTGRDMRVTLRRDGRLEERILEFVYQPIFSPDGTVSGILVQGIDLTDRYRAEETLVRVTAESERRRRLYETILSATPDFVYVFSLDHRVLYANDSLIAMWGCGPDGHLGKTFLEIGYEPWHAEMHDREIDQVRETKQPIRGEVPFTGTNGRRIYDYIFVPVFGTEGEVEAVAGTTRDVTERREMEDSLREADRKKDDFIALLAHELRNPLAPVRNGLQVMRLAGDNPALVEQTRSMMDRQLSHMVRLVDDLLDVSRISRNKMELRRSRVLLADVVNTAVEATRPIIDARGHQLTISLPPDPVSLDADLTRLAQVFGNLLSNSAKYTEHGGHIWLSAERIAGVVVVVRVRDTGIGIPRDSLAKIFDMFSQVDRETERNTGGLGIGLALVRGLAEMHGGTVTAESEGPGRGSTFIIRLPELILSPDSTDKPTPNDEPAASGLKRRILVVDDSRDGADSLSMMLGLMGNEVRTAYNGEEALEAAGQFRPEVVLMDVGMPRMNGLDATRRIRDQSWGRDMTIIALTGWGQDGDRERSREAGCDGHLVKPVSLPDLERLLDDLQGDGR
ncbi:PAS domain-containing hybrid sensor histidine kinase/response regulator [Zavarzinella formosa]|uniref:PAS domain-containing hybrid sensor histidine kinase/response regulator n=1 Tax=Zavarzinella formosa TaxID=360055 RepID=UPI0002FC5225|nr:PAS domain S-box protein [Zavarzinella formosa]